MARDREARSDREPTIDRRLVELAELHPDDVVLDVGCGNGITARDVARYVTNGRVIGVDPDPALIRIAQEDTAGDDAEERIEFHVGSAEQLPLPEGTVTVVLAIDSAGLGRDLEAALAEARRVLAPDGRLVIGAADGLRGADQQTERLASALERAGFVEIVVRDTGAGVGSTTLLTAVSP